jgi:hypothetical protein
MKDDMLTSTIDTANRRTIFPNIGLVWEAGNRSVPIGEPRAASEPSPPEPRTEAAGRKKILDTSKPIDLKLHFKPQKDNKSPDPSTSRLLKYEDPWKFYQKMLSMDHAGNMVGAYNLNGIPFPRMVTRVTPTLEDAWLQTILKIRHKHIILLHEAFINGGSTFLVSEMMHVSLEALLKPNVAFRESQVAKICSEVCVLFVTQNRPLLMLTVKAAASHYIPIF